MGIFDSKNEQDNKNYKEGYDVGRGSSDPLSSVADSLFRGFYGDEWNSGYEQGQQDKADYGKKD